MLLPLQITFRDLDPSPALETRIRELVQRLEKFSAQILRCHVIVEAGHGHGRQGHLFQVHFQVTAPGGRIIANREHRQRQSHEDVHVALRDAYRAVRRRLQDHERQRRREVKHHAPEPVGWVSELYPAEDFGRITTGDGRSVYFHRHSVVGTDFDGLTSGTAVRFVEEPGEQGPQASTVKLIARPGPIG
jgi:cold shock CspA family protein/ribosome-associated translation inhibitor RaiA